MNEFFKNPFGNIKSHIDDITGGYDWETGKVTLDIETWEKYAPFTVEENFHDQQKRVQLRNSLKMADIRRNILIVAILIGGYFYAK